MTMPAGVSLANVTFGKALGALGTEATITATVALDRPVVWAATGETFYAIADPVAPSAGGFLSFAVPHVDQPGFIDAAGNAVTEFAYVLTAQVKFSKTQTIHVTKAFQVRVGQGSVDLDLVPGGSITPGVTAPGPAVLSVAGLTGTVTLAQLATALAVPTPTSLAATFVGDSERAFQLQSEIRRGKGGKVGTAGKGVISLRFDHQLDAFRSTIAPLLLSRNLPYSIGIVADSVGQPAAPYEPTATTWAQVDAEILGQGGEVWSHSRTHGDGDGTRAALVNEIVNSKAVIQAALPTCRVMGWQQPGGPSTYGVAHQGEYGSWDDEAGRLIRNTYGLYEGYLYGTGKRMLPTEGAFGHSHVTIDRMTLQQAKWWVDEAAALRTGIQVMAHPGYIGQPTYMSVADYTAFLDYVVTKRDAGVLEVLTASALAYADPSSSYRANLIEGGDFETAVSGQVPRLWSISAGGTPAAAWNIMTDGGQTGARYLRLPAGQQYAFATAFTGAYGMDGHTFRLTGWVRSLDSLPPSWRMVAYSADKYTDATNTAVRSVSGTTTGAWQKIEKVFTLKRGYGAFYLLLGKLNGTAGTLDFDNLKLEPV